MAKTTTSGGSPTSSGGECAGIMIAPETYSGFVAGLVARAAQNHERGLRGRCS